MHAALIYTILGVVVVFCGLTILIVAGKIWRQVIEAYTRSRRRVLEPLILAYSHAEVESLKPALKGKTRIFDSMIIETILLDHIQRVRGIEKIRLGLALDELGFVDENIDKLRSSRWWYRADAAEKLGLAGSKRATERLVTALRDEIPEVRIRAAKALGAVGGKASAIPLIEALTEPNRWSTIRIADILAGMGHEVVEELRDSFAGMTLAAKLAALDIFARIKPLETVFWLRDRLGDPEADVRARACNAMGAIGDPGSGPVLAISLADTDWPVRAMAAKALGKILYRDAIPDLCNALRDQEWWVRANAAESLRLMSPEGIDALDAMVEDEDKYASHLAVLMLQEAGEVDRKVDLLSDGADPARREQAETWIMRLVGIGQVGRLVELSGAHPEQDVRNRLNAILSGDEEADGEKS